MYLLLAAIVPNFSFIIEGAITSDFELERDNFGIGTKAGCNLMVHESPITSWYSLDALNNAKKYVESIL